MKMRKLLTGLAAVLTAIVLCMTALADTEAYNLYTEAIDILFHTENVTLKLTADFYLNGQWFKTAEGTWKQDGDRAYRQLLLKSPRKDGTELHNGYTIVTEGTNYYLMEEMMPGIYRVGTTEERKSIIRRTVETEWMVRLGGLLASQAELLLGKDAVTETADGDVCLKLDKDSPSAVNAVLNQFVRFAAKRYFGIDYDMISADRALSFDVYTSTTQGILYTMKDVSLWGMTAILKKDGDGRLQHAEGEISLDIETATNDMMNLEIIFKADVSNRGSTTVNNFAPAEYGVNLQETAQEYYPDVENGGILELVEKKSAEVWAKTGYTIYETYGVSSYMHANRYDVSIEDVKGQVMTTCFTLEGNLLLYQMNSKRWLNASADQYDSASGIDAETDREARMLMKSFIEEYCPDLTECIADLKMEWMCKTDGFVYAQYSAAVQNEADKSLLFVVSVSPALQIEFFSREMPG